MISLLSTSNCANLKKNYSFGYKKTTLLSILCKARFYEWNLKKTTRREIFMPTTTHHVGAVLTTKYYLVNTNTVLNLQLVVYHVKYRLLVVGFLLAHAEWFFKFWHVPRKTEQMVLPTVLLSFPPDVSIRCVVYQLGQKKNTLFTKI